jgi:hypothetical protein
MKLASEIPRSSDWDAPIEQSISFSVEPLARWHKSVSTIKPVDHSVKLHVRSPATVATVSLCTLLRLQVSSDGRDAFVTMGCDR